MMVSLGLGEIDGLIKHISGFGGEGVNWEKEKIQSRC